MNSAHYQKMRELFRRARGYGGATGREKETPASSRTSPGGGDLESGWTADFHDRLFACLMRYEALQVIKCW